MLDDRIIPTGEHEPVGSPSAILDDESWDDAFDELATPPVFEVADSERTLAVEFLRGYSYAQVYTPAGRNFVCIEQMTAPMHALNSGDSASVSSRRVISTMPRSLSGYRSACTNARYRVTFLRKPPQA